MRKETERSRKWICGIQVYEAVGWEVDSVASASVGSANKVAGTVSCLDKIIVASLQMAAAFLKRIVSVFIAYGTSGVRGDFLSQRLALCLCRAP